VETDVRVIVTLVATRTEEVESVVKMRSRVLEGFEYSIEDTDANDEMELVSRMSLKEDKMGKLVISTTTVTPPDAEPVDGETRETNGADASLKVNENVRLAAFWGRDMNAVTVPLAETDGVRTTMSRYDP